MGKDGRRNVLVAESGISDVEPSSETPEISMDLAGSPPLVKNAQGLNVSLSTFS